MSQQTELTLWMPDHGPSGLVRSDRERKWRGRLPVLQGGVQQRHERAKYRKHWHERVFLALREAGWDGAPWNTIGLEYQRRSAVPARDWLNVAYSAKPIVDGLTNAGLIRDDNDGVIVAQTYCHVACKRSDQGVWLRVWRIEQ